MTNKSLKVGVNPALARRFFTDLTPEEVNNATGSSEAEAYRFFVKTLWILDPTIAWIGYIALFFANSWWGMVIAIVTAAANFVLKGSASFGGNGNRLRIFIVSLFFSGVAYIFVQKSLAGWIYLVSIPASVGLCTLTYRLAVVSVRMLASDNEKALNYFSNKEIFWFDN